MGKLEAVHAYYSGVGLRWWQQVGGMARRASWYAVFAVGITSPLPPAATGARSCRPTGTVSFYVFTQVVTTHKSLVANRTREPFLTGVCA